MVSLTCIYIAYWFYLRQPRLAVSLIRTSLGSALHRFWHTGWGFDWLYDRIIVRPYMWLAGIDQEDVIDFFYRGLAWLAGEIYNGLILTETGRVRWYAMGIAAGVVIVVAVVVFL